MENEQNFSILLKDLYDELSLKFNKETDKFYNNLIKIKNSKKELFKTMKKNPKYFNQNFINIIDNITLINDDLNNINEKIENISDNINKNILNECLDEIIIREETNKRIKKIMKPFIPYIILYNMYIEDHLTS